MDGSIAVEIFSRREGPVARITVCLCDSALAENEAYVDTNNCPWVVDFLEAKGLAKSTGRTRRSGYCIYPAMEFDREKIAKFEGGDVRGWKEYIIQLMNLWLRQHTI